MLSHKSATLTRQMKHIRQYGPKRSTLTPQPPRDEAVFPMRINKYLAHMKHSTRRGADELVDTGQVFINGRVAVLGEKVEAKDKVEVRRKGKQKELVYYAYHKPRGIITHSPGPGEKEIMEVIGLRDVFPVGRLDKDSQGLIILTNDGRITERLLHPRFDHEKEYLVTTKEPLRSSFKNKMEAGVRIENEMTKPCKVSIVNEHSFRVILTEGKKHQIRRMCVALFQEVKDLKRIRIMTIELGKLPVGEFRKIEGAEREKFLQSLGLV